MIFEQPSLANFSGFFAIGPGKMTGKEQQP